MVEKNLFFMKMGSLARNLLHLLISDPSFFLERVLTTIGWSKIGQTQLLHGLGQVIAAVMATLVQSTLVLN